MKWSWFGFVRPYGNSGDDRKHQRQRVLRTLIRWSVNGTFLGLIHLYLFDLPRLTAVVVGLVLGAWSAMLQYNAGLYARIISGVRIAALVEQCCPNVDRTLLNLLRGGEQFTRWFLLEIAYVFFSEAIRAFSGVVLIGSNSISDYVIQRLLSALAATLSQGAWEIAVVMRHQSYLQSSACPESKADHQRDWFFLLGSLVSVLSLAASLSPYPNLGAIGFSALGCGAAVFYCQALKNPPKH